MCLRYVHEWSKHCDARGGKEFRIRDPQANGYYFLQAKACSGQGASLALDPFPRDLQFSGEVLKRKIFVFCGSPLEAQAFGEHKEQGWGRSVA